MNLCKCGCGEITKNNNTWIIGHNRKGTIGPLKGKHHSEKTKKKMSISLTGKIGLSGKDNPMYGKSGPNLGKHPSEETRLKLSIIGFKRVQTKETKRKIGIAVKGNNNPMYGKPCAKGTGKNRLVFC